MAVAAILVLSLFFVFIYLFWPFVALFVVSLFALDGEAKDGRKFNPPPQSPPRLESVIPVERGMMPPKVPKGYRHVDRSS